MKRTKSPDRQIKRSLPGAGKTGPKSSCTDEVIQRAHRLALLGEPNTQIAKYFNKDVNTINYWRKTIPEFRQALKEGRKIASSDAVKRLYLLGMGLYEQERKKVVMDVEKEYDTDGNLIFEKKIPRVISYKEKLEPDRKALQKFLAVHNRETWGGADRVEHKHAHMHVNDTNIHNIMEGLDKYTNDELRAIAKLGLSEKQKQVNGNGHGSR